METDTNEMPVNSDQARRILGGARPWSRSYMSSLKAAMGVRSRYFLVSDVKQFLRDHPDFKSNRAPSGETFQRLLGEALVALKLSPKPPRNLLQRIERKLAAAPAKTESKRRGTPATLQS
jgi:hypothetical protein